MGCNGILSKEKIAEMHYEGKTIVEIAKTFARDHFMIKKFIPNSAACQQKLNLLLNKE